MDSPSQSFFSSKSSPSSLPPLSTKDSNKYSQVKKNSEGGFVMEGYLLKKKRKKMQGMARRYFRLDNNGEFQLSALLVFVCR